MKQKQTVEGAVEEILTTRMLEFARRTPSGITIVPIHVVGRLTLTDGRTAYLNTKVGDQASYDVGQLLHETFEPSPSQRGSSWPFIIRTGDHSLPTLIVYAGDKLTVRALAEERTSGAGNPYVRLHRVRIVRLERDGSVWAEEGRGGDGDAN